MSLLKRAAKSVRRQLTRLTLRAAEFVTRRRAAVSLLLIAVTAVALAGYRYEPPPRRPSNEDAPEEQGARLRVDSLGRRPADCFLVVETDSVFTPHGAAALRHVVESVEQLEYVESVMWLDTVPVLNVFGLRESLLPPNEASAERFAEARQAAVEHPLVRGQLLSADGGTLLMPIEIDFLYIDDDDDVSSELLATARAAAAEHPEASLRVRLTGRVPLFVAHKKAFDRNQVKFQVISYILVFGLSFLLFRGLAAVFIVAAAPALGIFWTIGILGLLDELTNPLTNVVLPVLLTMVGLADGVHLMVHIRKRRAEGMSPVESARSAIRNVGAACLLTSLTTAVGFGSLIVADSEFVRGFGRSCAIGVMLTFVAVVTLIPLLCTTWLARNVHRGQESDLVGRGLRRFDGVIDGVMQRSGLVSLLAVAVTLAFGVVASTLRPDDRMQDSQPTGSEAYQALAHCDDALGGIESVRIDVRWRPSVPENSPEILQAVRDVEQLLDGEELLHNPLSILGILSSLPGDEAPVDRLPFVALLPQSIRDQWFDPQQRQAKVTVRIQDLGIAQFEPVFGRVEQRLAELEQRHAGFKFQLAGDPVKRGRNLYRIVVDLAASLGTASVIIFLMMTLAYGSLRIGLISVVPNIFPLVVTASMLVALGHPLEIASVCSFTVCLGIAVDDTIHFLTRFRHEMQQDANVPGAVRRTFVGVGTAMVITTMILIVGFGTVLTSDLPGHRYFAAMAVSTIGAALVGDLLFLPALLVRFGGLLPRRKLA